MPWNDSNDNNEPNPNPEYQHPELRSSEEGVYRLGGEFLRAVENRRGWNRKSDLAGIGLLLASLVPFIATGTNLLPVAFVTIAGLQGWNYYQDRKTAISLRDKFTQAVDNGALDEEAQQHLQPLKESLDKVQDIGESDIRDFSESLKQPFNMLLAGLGVFSVFIGAAHILPWSISTIAKDSSRDQIRNIGNSITESMQGVVMHRFGRAVENFERITRDTQENSGNGEPGNNNGSSWGTSSRRPDGPN